MGFTKDEITRIKELMLTNKSAKHISEVIRDGKNCRTIERMVYKLKSSTSTDGIYSLKDFKSDISNEISSSDDDNKKQLSSSTVNKNIDDISFSLSQFQQNNQITNKNIINNNNNDIRPMRGPRGPYKKRERPNIKRMIPMK